MVGSSANRPVPLGTGKARARFRSSVFLKPGSLADDRQEVLYSFRHVGLWTPDASATFKRFRLEPGMYKVQVERRLAPQERHDLATPSVEFLAALLPELESRIASAEGARPSRPLP